MPDSVLLATADGSEATWAFTGAASRWQSVTVDDGDTSYVSLAGLTGTSAQSFVTADLPGAAVSVRTVQVRHRVRRATTVSPPSAVNAIIKLGTDLNGPVIGGAYWNRRPEKYYLDVLTPDIAKADATAWTVANINAAQVGVRLASLNPPADATEEVRVTYIALEVSWDAAKPTTNARFSMWIGSLLGPIVGSAIYAEHLPGIGAALARRTRGLHRLAPCDYLSLLDSFRAPRASYFCLGAR